MSFCITKPQLVSRHFPSLSEKEEILSKKNLSLESVIAEKPVSQDVDVVDSNDDTSFRPDNAVKWRMEIAVRPSWGVAKIDWNLFQVESYGRMPVILMWINVRASEASRSITKSPKRSVFLHTSKARCDSNCRFRRINLLSHGYSQRLLQRLYEFVKILGRRRVCFLRFCDTLLGSSSAPRRLNGKREE